MVDGESSKPSIKLDARGLRCPQPLLQTKRRLASMASDQVLEVWSDDASGFLDFAVFCQKTGHILLAEHTHADGYQQFFIQHK